LRATGAEVVAIQADLATIEGIDALREKYVDIGRPIDALFANAGRGLGKAFLDQNFDDVKRVVDTNVTGTLYLLHRFVQDMRQQGWGRVLITGSIAGLIPGTYNAVYNASKAFIDSFAYAFREEVREDGITVTVLLPGPTETEFFEKADLLDTKMGQAEKDDPGMVARIGYEAMLRGEGHEITGLANKLQAMMAHVMPPEQLAKMHEGLMKPGSARHH
jgi:short-subunit dehydrogenase